MQRITLPGTQNDPKFDQNCRPKSKNRKKRVKISFLEGFIFRRFFGKHFSRFFSILGSPNGVKTKNNHDFLCSLFRTFRVLATFGRFLSIFIDFGPHGTRKTAKNRRISAKKCQKFHSKKRFMNGGKRTCLTTSLATRYSPPGSHHQILTTRSSPPVPHHQRLTNHPHQPFQFNGRAVVPALPVQSARPSPWATGVLDLALSSL